VIEDLVDDDRVFEKGEDAAAAVAVGAGKDVDAVAAAEELRPPDVGVGAGAVLGLLAGSFLSFSCLLPRALRAVRWNRRPAAAGSGDRDEGSSARGGRGEDAGDADAAGFGLGLEGGVRVAAQALDPVCAHLPHTQ
jgi:hypothetical protein